MSPWLVGSRCSGNHAINVGQDDSCHLRRHFYRFGISPLHRQGWHEITVWRKLNVSTTGDTKNEPAARAVFCGGGRRAEFHARRGALSYRTSTAEPRSQDTGTGNGRGAVATQHPQRGTRTEEHTSELQSLMRISYADF